MEITKKQRAKMVLNASNTNKKAVSTPNKPKKLEDKKQSGFATTSVSSRYPGGLNTSFSIPKHKNHKKKYYD